MFERFTDNARSVVQLARQEAVELGHDHIGTGHLVLALTAQANCTASKVLRAAGANLDYMRRETVTWVGDAHGDDEPDGYLRFSPNARTAIELSLREALQLGHNYIGTEHLLLGVASGGPHHRDNGVGRTVLYTCTDLPGDMNALRATVRARVEGGASSGQPQEKFRVSAEWITADMAAAETMARDLMERGAETAGVSPLRENRCGCCGNPLAEEPVSTKPAEPGMKPGPADR